VLKAVNLVVRPLLSTRVGRRIGGLMLLEFTGRRTGRKITVPVTCHTIDGVPMAFTDRPWRLNFEGGAAVKVTHRGRVRYGQGTLVQVTPHEMGALVRKALDNGESKAMVGVGAARGYEPSAADLAALGPALGTSVLTFDVPD
jgi:hypothetical protein